MQNRLAFGDIEIRPAERAVWVKGAPAPVGARAYDVLAALVERRDRVVSKDELFDIVWPGLVVEENNLSVQISALRRVLGSPVIATVTGRGYRFVAAAQKAAAERAGTERVARRLAAVAAACVADWAELRARDAKGAAGLWSAMRSTQLEAPLAGLGARVGEMTPESMLIEFASAVDAVRWATALPGAPQGAGGLRLRIGIGVEDLMVEDGRLIGEGVVLARALMERAQAGGVVVCESTKAFTAHRLPVDTEPTDSVAVGGRTVPAFRLFRRETVRGPSGESVALATPEALARRRLPRVAVLPFASDEADAYFGDGMTEEIITALASNRALFVISRHSTLRYRNSQAAPAAIAGELDVRYLVQGSVRRQSDRVRVGAELVDAFTGQAIWAESFDGAGPELFDIQSRIAANIAAAIDPWVQSAEIARVTERPTDDFSAYDCVLRGMAAQLRFTPEDAELALSMFNRAIELDPRYAQAHAHLAWSHLLRIGEGLSPNRSEDSRAAEQCSRRALQLDPRDAWSLAVAGHIQSFIWRHFDEAMAMFEQALAINPNCTMAWLRSGTTLAYQGRVDEALERVKRALELSPFDPMRYSCYATCGIACLAAGRDDEAVGWLGKARALNPGYRAAQRMLIAALALAGEVQEARVLAEEFMHVGTPFSVRDFGQWYPMVQPRLDRVLQGMRLGGLPE